MATVSARSSLAAVLRTMCFRLLSQIPDEGLAELYETMEQILEFYASRPPEYSSGQSICEVPATRGESYVRPEFRFDEE